MWSPPTTTAPTATVAVTAAEMGAYLGEDDETLVRADLSAASVTTVVEYNVYDVNKDEAVDIDDLILILNNYTELFQ